jgi:hypothetical protein
VRKPCGKAAEEPARQIFDTYLQSQPVRSNVAWEKVGEHDDPPDYWLTIGKNKYAVEVTSVSETLIGGRDLRAGLAEVTRFAKQNRLTQDDTPVIACFPDAQATEMLSRTIEKKRGKMESKNVPKPWILLLWHDGLFVEPALMLKCAIHDHGGFHTAFLAWDHPVSAGKILWSEVPSL